MILLTQIFSPDTYGFAFCIIGIVARIAIRRRRFNRRVFYKTYRYSNYFWSELTPFFEWIIGLAALLLILLGMFIIIWA